MGALRCKRPQPKAPWDGVRPAKEFSAKAHQADLTREGFYAKEFYTDERIERSEDCLYLNIWTPAGAQPGDKLPVLFWVHGDGEIEKEIKGQTKTALLQNTIAAELPDMSIAIFKILSRLFDFPRKKIQWDVKIRPTV